jgi:hypothetical protein
MTFPLALSRTSPELFVQSPNRIYIESIALEFWGIPVANINSARPMDRSAKVVPYMGTFLRRQAVFFQNHGNS